MVVHASAMLGSHLLLVSEWKLQLVQPKKQTPEIIPSHRILTLLRPSITRGGRWCETVLHHRETGVPAAAVISEKANAED